MLGQQLRARQAECGATTIDVYRTNIARRAAIRQRAGWLLQRYDAFLSLSATGAAPVGLGWTGDPAVTVAGSLLGGPAMSLPLMADEGMPLGLQLLGGIEKDAELFAVAEWVWSSRELMEGARR